MIIAAVLFHLLTLPTPAQDGWPTLRVTPEVAPDSLPEGGLFLAPSAGAIDVWMSVVPCATKPTASYQTHGAVVKIRLQRAPARTACPTTGTPQAYRAHVSGLKAKRYQVIVLQADSKGRWQPWKAGVVVVQ